MCANSESAAAADRPTENLRAYDLVLQARDLYKHGSSDGQALLDARALYERAVALDPDYAAAHAYLGLTYIIDRMEASRAGPRRATWSWAWRRRATRSGSSPTSRSATRS